MQSLPSGVLQELQQQGETQAETESSPGTAAEGGGGGIPPRKESSTSVLLSSRDRSFTLSTPSPLFLQAPARESSRKPPSELLGGRGFSRAELSLPQRTSSERSEPGSGASPPPSWQCAAAEVPPQLLGRRTGTDASLRRLTPESIAESIQQYNSDMRAMLANGPLAKTPTLPRSLTIPRVPSPQHSHHSKSSISSITSEESYASSFAYSLRRSKPDLRLLRKSSKPSQHLKPRTSGVKAQANIPQGPTFYRPKVVEESRVNASTTKNLTPLPLAEEPLSLTMSELLKSDPEIQPVHRVKTFGSGTRPSRPRAAALKSAISQPMLPRGISSPQLGQAAAPSELPHRPPAKPTRQLRFESPHSGKSSPHDFSVNSHLNLADPATGFHKNSHLAARRHQKHYHDVTPPEDEPGISNQKLFQHDDSYFHTFGADTMSDEAPGPVQAQASGKLQSVIRVISAPGPRKLSTIEEPGSKIVEGRPALPQYRKRGSSTLFGLFKKTAIKELPEGSSKSLTSHGERRFRVSKAEARRFGTPEDSAKPTPSPMPETPVITLEASTDHDIARRRSVVPELRMPSYFTRPKMHRLDSDWSLSPSPGHNSAVSPGSSEVISESGSTTPYLFRPRRHRRSSSEALSPMGMHRQSPSVRSRSPHVDSVGASGIEDHEPPEVVPHLAATSKAPRALVPEDSEKAEPPTTVIDFADAMVNGKSSQLLTSQGTTLKRKPSMWKGVMHGLRKMSLLGFLDQEGAATDDLQTWKRHRLSVMPKLSRMSLPKISLRASGSSINVRNGRLVRKASRVSQSQGKQAHSEDDDAPSREQRGGPHRDSQITPKAPVRRAISPEDLIVTEFEQTPFSKRYYDAIRAEQQVIRALMGETMEEDDEADDEIVLGFEQNVPDHLPTSPLCPLSPKHKSGGKAICPLHGKYKRRKSVPSPQHKIEIVFDTREEHHRTQTLRLGGDGTGLVLDKLNGDKYPSAGRERRRLHTSSMGSDGTESIVVQLEVSKVWSRPRRRRLKQRSSEHRGRSLARGESSVEIRHRRRQKGRR